MVNSKKQRWFKDAVPKYHRLGEKWNLDYEWVFRAALNYLRDCKINCVDELQIPKNYLKLGNDLLIEYERLLDAEERHRTAWTDALSKDRHTIVKNRHTFGTQIGKGLLSSSPKLLKTWWLGTESNRRHADFQLYMVVFLSLVSFG